MNVCNTHTHTKLAHPLGSLTTVCALSLKHILLQNTLHLTVNLPKPAPDQQKRDRVKRGVDSSTTSSLSVEEPKLTEASTDSIHEVELDWDGHSQISHNTRLKSNRFILNHKLSERCSFFK